MRIGRLNVPFLLQSETLVADGEGGHNGSWLTLASLWGNLRVASEESPSDLKRKITHHILVRYRTDFEIQTGQRLVKDGRAFLIRAVSNVGEDDRWLRLFVEETKVLN